MAQRDLTYYENQWLTKEDKIKVITMRVYAAQLPLIEQYDAYEAINTFSELMAAERNKEHRLNNRKI